MQIHLKRGLNRIFIVLTECWAVFWLLVFPVGAGEQGRIHYEADLKFCYEQYGLGTDHQFFADCLAMADREFKEGLYTGVGFIFPEGHGWSFRGYYQHMGWILVGLILVPPLLVYSLAWGISIVLVWIWRGFSSV
jgi:hypothetical protein